MEKTTKYLLIFGNSYLIPMIDKHNTSSN